MHRPFFMRRKLLTLLYVHKLGIYTKVSTSMLIILIVLFTSKIYSCISYECKSKIKELKRLFWAFCLINMTERTQHIIN
jgi:hypothetical protein